MRAVLPVITMFVTVGALVGMRQGTLGVSFKLSDPMASVGQLVFITFTVQNWSSHEIRLDLGRDRKEAFHFALQRADGHFLAQGQTPELPELTRIGRITIPAGSSYSEKFLLNEWLPLNAPGRFKLLASFGGEIRAAGGVVDAQRTEQMDITIEARNEQRLRESFQNLLSEALQAPTAEERLQAASALQHAADVEAVPFLTQLLQGGGTNAHLGVEPLARIGTAAAAQGLIRALDSPDAEVAALARGRLQSLLRQTGNPEVSSLIQKALRRR